MANVLGGAAASPGKLGAVAIPAFAEVVPLVPLFRFASWEACAETMRFLAEESADLWGLVCRLPLAQGPGKPCSGPLPRRAPGEIPRLGRAPRRR